MDINNLKLIIRIIFYVLLAMGYLIVWARAIKEYKENMKHPDAFNNDWTNAWVLFCIHISPCLFVIFWAFNDFN